MKKILILFFIFITNFISAQPIVNLEYFDNNKLQWGYYFGLNTMDFKYKYNEFDYNTANTNLFDAQTKKTTGFNVGLTGDIRLIEHLNLRFEPGLVYNKREVYFPGFEKDTDKIREVNSTYIYMPLLIKYGTKRWYNVKPYITGGASMVINLSSNHKLNVDNSENKFRTVQNVFFYELGFGIDFYTPHFRFSPSIRGLFSINNELIPDKDPNSRWTGNLKGIFTRGFMINLTFE
ncbi:MAG: porin family protein [Capnocytophaga sp.]|nr:porin family protein [Capnocytophaga sp.]